MTDDLPVPTRYFEDLPLLEADFERLTAEAAATAAAATTPPASAVTSAVPAPPQLTLQGGRDGLGGPPPAAAAAVALSREEQERLAVLRERSIERRRTKVAENQYVINKGPR